MLKTGTFSGGKKQTFFSDPKKPLDKKEPITYPDMSIQENGKSFYHQ